MTSELIARLRRALPPPSTAQFCSVRWVREAQERISVRQDVLEPVQHSEDQGVMVTVFHQGGLGYAATSDLRESALREAVQRAQSWAEQTRDRAIAYGDLAPPHPSGEYHTPVQKPWDALSVRDKIQLLQEASARLHPNDRMVAWEAALWRVRAESLALTNGGGEVQQTFEIIAPHLSVTASHHGVTQTRSLGSFERAAQGGLELLDRLAFSEQPERLAREVLELLAAPNCPTGTMDLVLMPDQMLLQIHESIGHPLELDRILGDERNYAGTSFVTREMFGTYQYGSPLLNVTFDPSIRQQLASYGFDDEGAAAERTYIIKDGILQRPLGSVFSQARAELSGTANARACSWNRPPIDRMANLNLEPGESSLEDLIAGVESGVLMRTNCSWSIDDSRNKFQFGCEYGQRIEDGELTEVVRNPNYRGVSATFWRNLSAVGNASTFEVLGTPFCGKGEPNQVIRVGHASPACRFRDVDVFGGA